MPDKHYHLGVKTLSCQFYVEIHENSVVIYRMVASGQSKLLSKMYNLTALCVRFLADF